EEQIADIGETTVTLKSGGYLIINPTEALVSIDVNSGKATKERHIEETALKTNLEAAEEIARQLRLRDLGGLVVIDFIDMEDRRNNGKVERKMREALSGDKARIQIGKISSFGLMEMSRQRMSASLGETQFETCKHCAGTGRVRTADAATILILRDIENEGQKGRAAEVIVHVSSDVALYILNNKRQNISDLEARYDMAVVIRVDDSLGASCRVEVSKPKNKKGSKGSDDSADEGEVESANTNTNESSDNDDDDNKDGNSSRRRRGRRGGRRRNNRNNADEQSAESKEADPKSDESTQTKSSDEGKDEKPKKKSIRKTKAKDNDELDAEKDEKPKAKAKSKSKAKDAEKSDEPASKEKSEEKSEDKAEEKPKRTRKSSRAKAKDAEKKDEAAKEEKSAKSDSAKKPAKAKKVKASNDDKPAEPEAKDYENVNEAPKTKKQGWWNKLTD
ncbi:MAG: ribonuclease E/G, partial [Pseudomonadota bacterium]|nr:ribonuclease E/G [Pseudomonadota bacterium]